MKSITELLNMAQARISGRREYGPLGVAIASLNVVVAEGRKREVVSPTFDAIKVVLDHVHKQREALEVAGLLVLSIDAMGQEQVILDLDPKAKGPYLAEKQRMARLVPDLLKLFKEKAVAAKLHQDVPPSDAERKAPGTQ